MSQYFIHSHMNRVHFIPVQILPMLSTTLVVLCFSSTFQIHSPSLTQFYYPALFFSSSFNKLIMITPTLCKKKYVTHSLYATDKICSLIVIRNDDYQDTWPALTRGGTKCDIGHPGLWTPRKCNWSTIWFERSLRTAAQHKVKLWPLRE